jgi:hypothetical protein
MHDLEATLKTLCRTVGTHTQRQIVFAVGDEPELPL